MLTPSLETCVAGIDDLLQYRHELDKVMSMSFSSSTLRVGILKHYTGLLPAKLHTVVASLQLKMANQSAKKAQRASASLSTRLQLWIVPINVLHLLYCLVWHYSSVTLWTLVGYVFLSLSTYLCYSWIVGAAQEGGSSEYAMDVLIVTLFVQAGLLISNYFWLVYLVIPGYLLYHGGRMLLNYVFTPNATDDDDPNALKKKEKAERKAGRPKYKSHRR